MWPLNIIKEDEVPLENTWALQMVTAPQSTGSEQGILSAVENQCQTNKWACRKNIFCIMNEFQYSQCRYRGQTI